MIINYLEYSYKTVHKPMYVKRYLTGIQQQFYNVLAEAHKMYSKEYNDQYKAGFSKFCELRPKNMKLFDTIPHNMCVRISRKCLLKNHTDLPTDVKTFSDSMICSEMTKKCE